MVALPFASASLRNIWHENRDIGGMRHLVPGPIAHLLFAKVLPLAVVCGLIELMLRFLKKRSVTGVASARNLKRKNS